MRIGINTLFLVPGDVGGTEVYLHNTISAMVALCTEDTIVLFTNNENNTLLRNNFGKSPNVEFHQLPCRAAIRPLRILIEQLLLPFAAKKQSIDVLWSPGYTAPVVCFTPQAVTIHDLQYKSHPEDMSLFERVTLDVLVRTACKCCNAVITISEFSKREILFYGFAKAKKIHAILLGVAGHFAVDLPDRKNNIYDILKKKGIQKPYILSVAHTYPHKNIDRLVDAFNLFSKKNPHQLILVGKARRGEKKVQKNLDNLINPGKVIRLNSLTETELKLLYQNADIFILPSGYEGFGLPVLEAMMAGTPVIASQMASLPELGGECIVYVATPTADNLFQAMEKIMAFSQEQLLEQTTRAQKRACSFTWERTGRQTLCVLRKLTMTKK